MQQNGVAWPCRFWRFGDHSLWTEHPRGAQLNPAIPCPNTTSPSSNDTRLPMIPSPPTPRVSFSGSRTDSPISNDLGSVIRCSIELSPVAIVRRSPSRLGSCQRTHPCWKGHVKHRCTHCMINWRSSVLLSMPSMPAVMLPELWSSLNVTDSSRRKAGRVESCAGLSMAITPPSLLRVECPLHIVC